MQIVRELCLDFYNHANALVAAKEGDNGRFLLVSILECGKEYQIPEGATASIACGKVYAICEILDNKILAPLVPDMLTKGRHDCQIELLKEDEKLTSMSFEIQVEGSARDDNAIPGDTDLGPIDRLVQQAVEAVEKAQALARKIQDIINEGNFTGPANVLQIGTVRQGTAADASITGSAPSQILNLTLPQGPEGPKGLKGDTGPGCKLAIGTVEEGTVAQANISGTEPNQVLNLVLPQGPEGPRGLQGESGFTVTGDGIFCLIGDEEGNLWAYYPGEQAPAFDVDEAGNIYYVII